MARREGQTFEGVRVKRIRPDRVELVGQGRERVLRFEFLPQVRSSQQQKTSCYDTEPDLAGIAAGHVSDRMQQ